MPSIQVVSSHRHDVVAMFAEALGVANAGHRQVSCNWNGTVAYQLIQQLCRVP